MLHRLQPRQTLPASVAAHTRSFGIKVRKCQTRHPVASGMPQHGPDILQLEDRTLPTEDSYVRLVLE